MGIFSERTNDHSFRISAPITVVYLCAGFYFEMFLTGRMSCLHSVTVNVRHDCETPVSCDDAKHKPCKSLNNTRL